MVVNGCVCYEDENGVNEDILHYFIDDCKNVIIPDQFTMLETGCFQESLKLESVEIPESVTFIKSLAFADCPNLKSVKIPGNLYSIGADAFGDAKNTAEILKTNPNYIEQNGFIINKSNNTLLFVLDTKKESYKIPENIKNIGYSAFLGCDNLKEITIPENVENIEMMSFFCCRKLEKILFPKGLKFIGGAAFAFCDNLKDFSIPKDVQIIEFGNEVFFEE